MAKKETPPTGTASVRIAINTEKKKMNIQFSQKHHRQVTLVVKAPPMIGPKAPAMAQIAPKIP